MEIPLLYKLAASASVRCFQPHTGDLKYVHYSSSIEHVLHAIYNNPSTSFPVQAPHKTHYAKIYIQVYELYGIQVIPLDYFSFVRITLKKYLP